MMVSKFVSGQKKFHAKRSRAGRRHFIVTTISYRSIYLFSGKQLAQYCFQLSLNAVFAASAVIFYQLFANYEINAYFYRYNGKK